MYTKLRFNQLNILLHTRKDSKVSFVHCWLVQKHLFYNIGPKLMNKNQLTDTLPFALKHKELKFNMQLPFN